MKPSEGLPINVARVILHTIILSVRNPFKRARLLTTGQKQCHLTDFFGNSPSTQWVQLSYSALASSRFSILERVACHPGLYKPGANRVNSYTGAPKLVCSCFSQRVHCCLGRGVCRNKGWRGATYYKGPHLQSTVPAPERRPATEKKQMSSYR